MAATNKSKQQAAAKQTRVRKRPTAQARRQQQTDAAAGIQERRLLKTIVGFGPQIPTALTSEASRWGALRNYARMDEYVQIAAQIGTLWNKAKTPRGSMVRTGTTQNGDVGITEVEDGMIGEGENMPQQQPKSMAAGAS